MIDLRDKLQQTYALHGSLETTCCRQCGCCRVNCPMMTFSEASVILTKVWNEWPKEDLKKFLSICIKHFFSRSLVKPCPLLQGSDCRIYLDRPLHCRLYGQIPAEDYAKRVESKCKELNLPKEQIPLNTQCPKVRRKAGSSLTSEMIQDMENALNCIDEVVLSKKYRPAEARAKIKKSWNLRKIEDWALFVFLGEDLLVKMSKVAMLSTPEELRKQIKTFETLLETIV